MMDTEHCVCMCVCVCKGVCSYGGSLSGVSVIRGEGYLKI